MNIYHFGMTWKRTDYSGHCFIDSKPKEYNSLLHYPYFLQISENDYKLITLNVFNEENWEDIPLMEWYE